MRPSRLVPWLISAGFAATACGGPVLVEAPDAGERVTTSPDAGQELGTLLPTVTVDDVRQAEGNAGNSLTFTVSLDHAPVGGEVRVAWRTEDGSATAGSDFEADSGVLTFTTGGPTSATVTVQVDGDDAVEPDETFSLVLSVTGAKVAKDRGTATLLADDFPTISIADASAPEGEALAFAVTLSAAPVAGYPITVDWATFDATAVAPGDYTAANGTLTFAPGEGLSQTITIAVNDDADLEPDEGFALTLAKPVNATLAAALARGTIQADDFPHVTAAAASASESDGTLEFTVSIDAAPPAGLDAQVSWATADGSATAGNDYVPASGTLHFSSNGPLQQTVSVALVGDSVIEQDEDFSLVLADPVHATIGAAARGEILNDDWPQLSIADASVNEGDTGTTDLAFTVTISDVPLEGQTATVQWATSDGTTNSTDFTAANGTLTFAPGGSPTRTVHVAVTGDTTLEHDETFTVQLAGAVHATMARSVATGRIVNDDFPTASIADAGVLEGAGSLVFTVSLDTPPLAGEDAQVAWSTSPGTASAADFTASSGTLTFAETRTQTITVPLTADADIEPDETFTITLASPNRLKIGRASATGTILADDFPTVSITGASGLEGDSGTTDFPFALTLSAAPPAGYPLQVDWATSDGTAVAPTDYAAGSGTVTFAPGETLPRNVIVKVNGDTASEADETFRVTLSNAVHGNLGTAQATGTIRTDDVPKASISDARVKEGDFGSNELVFTVTLDAAPPAGQDAQLSWATADGSASAGSDYVASTGTLTFTSAGPRTQRLAVPILGDTANEGLEQFTVRLTAVANVALQTGIGTGTIVDDELPALSIDDVTRAEGAAGTTTPFTFTVSANPAPKPGLDVTVAWSTANLSAFSPTDYAAASGTLTFTAGEPTSATITVNVAGNATKELQKQFKVLLANPVNATILDGTGLGTIVDDDGAVIRVDASATGTADGLTWATAYRTVQAGVDRAQALGGGQVWVAAGTYNNGGGTGPVLAMKNLVTVVGGFDGFRGGAGAQETAISGRDPVNRTTTLDGANTAYHVVTGATAVLDGFTITGGNANSGANTNDSDPGRRGGGIDHTSGALQVMNCVIRNNTVAGNGGAINASTSLTVHDTKMLNNTANNGGAIYTTATLNLFDDLVQGNYAGQFTLGGGYGGGVQDASQSTSTYTNVTFDNNHGTYGGGLHMTFGKSTVRGCTFTNNLAQGSLGASGGGFYDDSWSASKVYDSVFVGNRAGDNGGGIELRDSDSIVSNCRIENNTASYGAGLFMWNYFGGTSRIFNSRFAYNRASGGGGGVYHLQSSSPVFVNVVFEGNDGGAKGGALYNAGSTPTLVNAVFLNDTATNGAEILNEAGGSPSAPSVPVLANSIVLNRTFAPTAVVNTSGSVSATNTLSSDNGKDPRFNHVPIRASRTTPGSTASVLNVPNAAQFAVNDAVEVANDGVARRVTAVSSTAITISPALGAAPALYTHVDDWGAGATDLSTDLRLRADSPAIDAGSNAAMKPDAADVDRDGDLTEPVPLDLVGNARFVDEPGVADTGSGPGAIVDIGAIERPAP